MELYDLELFLSAVRTGNFSVTAEQNNITQSSVSKRIHALEAELGSLLFDRFGRRVIPNEAARLILPYAEAILAQHQSMTAEIKHYLVQHQNVLNIGMLGFSALYGFWNVLSRFQIEHQDIPVTVHALKNQAILDALDGFSCNFGLLYDIGPVKNKYQTWPLIRDRLGICYIQDLPQFRGRDTISIRELEQCRLALHAEGTQIGDYARELLEQYDVHPASIYTDFYLEPIYQLMTIQPMLLVMPVGTLNPPKSVPEIHICVLEESAELSMSLVHSKTTSLTNAEKVFIRHCTEYSELLRLIQPCEGEGPAV